MAQVIIVSNRLPVSVKKVDGELEFYPSVGGLATGLASYVKNPKNRWIGWPGIASDELTEQDKHNITKQLAKYHCHPVFLSQKQLDEYYSAYSNGVLWPLLHNLPIKARADERAWKTYRAVNKLFADAVLALSQQTSVVWVHDYLLMLVPKYLRRERPADNIGFFLHIPFPTPQVFAKLPQAKSLIEGMLGSNLIGFHTRTYAQNFLDSAQQLSTGVSSSEQVILADRVVRVTDFPMGIDYNKFARASRTRAVRKIARQYKRKYRGKKVILTVDRVDPTKGLVERAAAYKELLQTNPQFHRKVVMAMVAVPSRTDIKEYQLLTKRLEKLVLEINATYGESAWQPIDYMYTSLPFEELTALYRVADVAFIAPLRDGMNLVAKEYIASKPKQNGVLILSETAGAAQELTEALLVNPRKRDSLVNALSAALTMPKHELKKRAAAMQKRISTRTVQHWAGSFMKSLQQPLPGRHLITRTLRGKLHSQLITDYRLARRRLLLLDYDGVLTILRNDPRHALPTATLIKLLTDLAADPANEVAVISGRSKHDLNTWFENLPIDLVGEHGAVFKKAAHIHWHQTVAGRADWQRTVMPVLETYTARTPGAFIEKKDCSIVWHYRGASAYYAQKSLVALKRLLRPIARKHELAVLGGNKILEIRSIHANKGSVALELLKPTHDFVLAIGDDETDEDMFTHLPPAANTIKVGRGRTHAAYRLPGVGEVHRLLKQFSR